MTDMYDKPRSFEGGLKAYPHEDRGCEVCAGFYFLRVAVASMDMCVL